MPLKLYIKSNRGCSLTSIINSFEVLIIKLIIYIDLSDTLIRIILPLGICGPKYSCFSAECCYKTSLNKERVNQQPHLFYHKSASSQFTCVLEKAEAHSKFAQCIQTFYLGNTYCLLLHGFMYCCSIMFPHTAQNNVQIHTQCQDAK